MDTIGEVSVSERACNADRRGSKERVFFGARASYPRKFKGTLCPPRSYVKACLPSDGCRREGSAGCAASCMEVVRGVPENFQQTALES